MSIRRLTWIFNRPPSFFLVGGMKCGTTSLWQYLAQHRSIVSSRIKEPCYFSYKYSKGYLWYLSNYPSRHLSRGSVAFDASPVYLHDPASPKRLFNRFPSAKLVVLLRDPIQRSISHYNYYSDPGSRFAINNPAHMLDQRSLETAFRDDIMGREHRVFYKYCSNSLYAKQIKRFLMYYDLANIYIIDSADLLNNANLTLTRLLQFLEIEPVDFYSGYETGNDTFNGNESLELRLTDENFNIFNSQTYSTSLADEFENVLKEFYREDVKYLRQLGLDFEWMNRYER